MRTGVIFDLASLVNVDELLVEAQDAGLDSPICTDRARELDDVPDLLVEMRLWTAAIGVVSTLPSAEVTRCLKATGLYPFVDGATGDDWPTSGRPSPHLYGSMVDALVLDPARSIAVTHTAGGVAAARQADLYTVADPHAYRTIDADSHLASYRHVSVNRLLTLPTQRRRAA